MARRSASTPSSSARERKLALFTNAGFEDVIELARLRMPETYSLFCSRPEQLITRDRVFGIPARMRSDGRETVKPDLEVVAAAVQSAKARGAEGVVIAFLHAWRDGAQERAVKAEIARLAPELFVFTSAEVWPVIREYERTTTAILNAYVHPRIAGYLTALEERLVRSWRHGARIADQVEWRRDECR